MTCHGHSMSNIIIFGFRLPFEDRYRCFRICNDGTSILAIASSQHRSIDRLRQRHSIMFQRTLLAARYLSGWLRQSRKASQPQEKKKLNWMLAINLANIKCFFRQFFSSLAFFSPRYLFPRGKFPYLMDMEILAWKIETFWGHFSPFFGGTTKSSFPARSLTGCLLTCLYICV